MSAGKAKALKTAPGLFYAVEQNFTLVVKESSGEAFRLSGIEQIVWDCLNFGYHPQRVAETLAAGKMSLESAELALEGILQEWQMLGLIEEEADQDG